MRGIFKEFDGTENWETYYERFENWAQVNEIPKGKWTGHILAAMGAETYGKLKALIDGWDPRKMDFSEICTYLSEHFSPAPIEIAERFKFLSIEQSLDESTNDFILRLGDDDGSMGKQICMGRWSVLVTR